VDENSSAIGIWLKLHAPWRAFTRTPSWIAFVRLDDETGSIPEGAEIIRSNYGHENHLYLLNPEPGRYVAVAAFRDRQPFVSDEVHFYFSEELIELTEVTVAPGEIAVMGVFSTDSVPMPRSFESLVLKKEYNVGDPLALLATPYQSDRGDSAREGFLIQMKEHLNSSGWIALIDENLEALPASK